MTALEQGLYFLQIKNYCEEKGYTDVHPMVAFSGKVKYEEEEYVLDETEEYSAESLTEYRAPLYRLLPGDFLYPRLPEDEKTVYAALWTGAQEPEKDAYVAFETYSCTAGDKTEAREQDPMSAEERSRAACAFLFDHPEIY